MFDRKLVYTIAGMGLVTMLALSLGQLPESQGAAETRETVDDVEIAASRADSESGEPQEHAYLMRELNGRIAVFVVGEEEPFMVLDTLVRHLPDYDQVLLEQGILIRTSGELAALIEDYIS